MISGPMRSAPQYRAFTTKNAALFHFTGPIHILGAGSIGLLWAASIRSVFPSYPVQLLLRNHHKNRLILPDASSPGRNAKIAICLHSKHNINERKLLAPRTVHVPAALMETQGSRPFQNLLLTTKAFQALPAIEAVAHRINAQTRIIILSNGALAIRETLLEFLQTRFPNGLPRIHLAMTTHGAYRDNDDDDTDEILHVVHAGYGKTSVEDYPDLAQLFDLSGLNCESSSTLDRDLWFKLAANCVINPLTALYRCANGEIQHAFEQNHKEESFDTYMTNILQEVFEVARHVAPQGEDFLSLDVLQTYVQSVMDATAANKSSMLQDILAGRETEIDYLNGFVVQQGKRKGILCPVNLQLVHAIRGLSQ